MRVASEIVLTDEERAELNELASLGTASPRLAQRARLVLLAADGMQNKGIAVQLGVGRVQVSRWRERYAKWRVAGIENELPRGAPAAQLDGDPPDEGLAAPAQAPAAHAPPEGVRDVVATTKLTPPRGARRLMRREALMARLQQARGQRCVIVQGQAGSGKTCTLLAWRRALLSVDCDVAWLSLGAEDGALTSFLDGLLTSIAAVDPAIVREAALLTGREGGENGIEHWAITLVQGIARHPRELVLMLDDLHHVEDERIFEVLQWLLEYAPPHLRFAFSSRSALPLSLERLRSQGMLTELDMRDLRFTQKESERYLREQLGGIAARDAADLHTLTDGWVAGLQLFVLDLRAKKGESYARVQVQDAQAFAEYFEREILVRLEPEELDLLTRVAVCTRFCASLCVAILGDPQSAPSVGSRLTHLHHENFFITQVGGTERDPWYRLHPLLREALLRRIAAWPAQTQRALHLAARDWFAAHGDIDDAVHHAVQAGDVAGAAAMVEGVAHEMLSAGELIQLAGLLRRLPEQQVCMRFELLVAQAYLQMYMQDFEAFEHSLRTMESQRDKLSPRERYDVTLLRCGLALLRDDTDLVMASLPELRAVPADAADLAWTSRNNILAWAHICQGEYEEARKVFDDEPRRGAPRSVMLGRCMSAMSLALQGEARQAERLVRDVLQEADRRGAAYVGVACMAAGLLAGMLYELNDAQAARQLLEPRMALLERTSLPAVVQNGLLVLSACHESASDRTRAEAHLERLEAYAVRHGLDRVLAEASVVRLRRHLRHDEMQAAIETLQRIEGLATKHERSKQGASARVLQAAGHARLEMDLYTRNYTGASTHLAPLLAACEGGRQPLRAVELRVQGALIERGLGLGPAARDQLLAAVRLGHRLGLVRTLLDVSPLVPRMLEELLAGGTDDPVLQFYVRRLLAAAAGSPEGPPAAADDAAASMQALSERESEVAALLAQAMPNKKIARVLNVSPDTIKFHLKNIYGKLGVTARDEAVARLRDIAARQGESG